MRFPAVIRSRALPVLLCPPQLHGNRRFKQLVPIRRIRRFKHTRTDCLSVGHSNPGQACRTPAIGRSPKQLVTTSCGRMTPSPFLRIGLLGCQNAFQGVCPMPPVLAVQTQPFAVTPHHSSQLHPMHLTFSKPRCGTALDRVERKLGTLERRTQKRAREHGHVCLVSPRAGFGGHSLLQPGDFLKRLRVFWLNVWTGEVVVVKTVQPTHRRAGQPVRAGALHLETERRTRGGAERRPQARDRRIRPFPRLDDRLLPHALGSASVSGFRLGWPSAGHWVHRSRWRLRPRHTAV